MHGTGAAIRSMFSRIRPSAVQLPPAVGHLADSETVRTDSVTVRPEEIRREDFAEDRFRSPPETHESGSFQSSLSLVLTYSFGSPAIQAATLAESFFTMSGCWAARFMDSAGSAMMS